ncbi:ABC transporter ATP-binding protein [Calidithermus roseus]|nr:ABC transporter ATP-binding protein [Calidithermus roseus]
MQKGLAALRVVPKALRLLRDAGASHLYVVFALTILQGLLPPAMGYFGKLIVDHLASGRGATAGLWALVGAEGLLAVALAVAFQLSNIYQAVLRERLWQMLSIQVCQHASQLDLDFFEVPQNYDALTKANRELGFRPMMMVLNLVTALQQTISVAGFVLVILAFQPLLVVAILIALVPAALAARDSGHITFTSYDVSTADGRRAAYFDGLMMSDGAAKELRLFDLAPWLLAQRQQYAVRVIKRRLRAAWVTGKSFVTAAAVSAGAQYLALAFVAYQAATGRITLGDFTLLAAALVAVRHNLSLALANLGELLENSLFFSDLDRFFDFSPKIRPPATPRPLPSSEEYQFVFENVGFTYTGASRPVFESLSFELRGGEATALVGVNGAGKTTIVKLLTRLYDPQQGRILLNGVDIREFPLEQYRAIFGVILQDFVRYHLTARENILVAKVSANPDDRRLEEAARLAKADSVIKSLPMGWGTMLGRQFDEQGQALSGGQWQRIALARALYRDAPVLILDEPTAGLDAEAEAELFLAYRELTRGKTSLLITHRLNTVRMADRILVLEGGKIVEDGSHQELLRKGGRYYELFTAQASTYGAEVTKP